MPTYKNKEYVKIMRPLPQYVKKDIYDIPYVEKDDIDISNLNNGKWLINIKNCSAKDKNASKKIVHNFCYDSTLFSNYNNPYNYLEKVGPYEAVCTFDFSMDSRMNFSQILSATYANRWIGAFMQANGKKVIVTAGWVGPEYYDITFAGIRDGVTLIISTLGANNIISYDEFIQGYHELRKRCPDSKIICIGKRLDGMDGDICYIEYEESFGSWDCKQDYWQPKLFNWDMTPAVGGDSDGIQRF